MNDEMNDVQISKIKVLKNQLTNLRSLLSIDPIPGCVCSLRASKKVVFRDANDRTMPHCGSDLACPSSLTQTHSSQFIRRFRHVLFDYRES